MPAEMTLDEFFADVGTPRLRGKPREMSVAEYRAKQSAPDRSARMREVQAIGERGEEVTAEQHVLALGRRVARVVKLPTPFKIVGRDKRGLRAVPDTRSTVDHVGHMKSGRRRGVAVYAETKRCGTKRFNLKEVEEHQRAALDEALADGCIAVLVVIYGPAYQVHGIPWEDVRAFMAAGAKSYGPEDLAPYLVPPGGTYLDRYAR